ncbi:MAG: hypothetical protein ACLUGY_21300 [Phocaeicola massiliensis]
MKYRAACFLIENMPRWYSYDGWQLDTLHALLERQLAGTLRESDRMWHGFDYHTLEKVYDARVITSDYLIRNIEMSFRNGRKGRGTVHCRLKISVSLYFLIV